MSSNSLKFPEKAEFGQYIKQGDVFIKLIDSVPYHAKAMPYYNNNEPIDPGRRGISKHILNTTGGVKRYSLQSENETDGPILEVHKDCKITHPEHGDVILNAGQTYAIQYRRVHCPEKSVV